MQGCDDQDGPLASGATDSCPFGRLTFTLDGSSSVGDPLNAGVPGATTTLTLGDPVPLPPPDAGHSGESPTYGACASYELHDADEA